MHKNKVTLHLDKTNPHDFDLSDEVQSLDFSFLYVLTGGFTIQIVSILTSNTNSYLTFLGQVVKVIDFSQSLLQQSKKASAIRFDRITLAHYLEVYLNSSTVTILFCLFQQTYDGTYFVKLDNQNTVEQELQYARGYKALELWSAGGNNNSAMI